MDLNSLTPAQRQLRGNIRSFCLPMTLPELLKEHQISLDRNDTFRAACIKELALEWVKENL